MENNKEEKIVVEPVVNANLSCHHALVHNPFVWEDEKEQELEEE